MAANRCAKQVLAGPRCHESKRGFGLPAFQDPGPWRRNRESMHTAMGANGNPRDPAVVRQSGTTVFRIVPRRRRLKLSRCPPRGPSACRLSTAGRPPRLVYPTGSFPGLLFSAHPSAPISTPEEKRTHRDSRHTTSNLSKTVPVFFFSRFEQVQTMSHLSKSSAICSTKPAAGSNFVNMRRANETVIAFPQMWPSFPSDSPEACITLGSAP